MIQQNFQDNIQRRADWGGLDNRIHISNLGWFLIALGVFLAIVVYLFIV